MRHLIALLLSFTFVTAQSAEATDANALMRNAIKSAQAGQFDEAITQMQAAIKLRPAHPAYLYNLACMQSLGGQTEDALRTLNTMAEFGIYTPAAKDSDFTALAHTETFTKIVTQFIHNRQPRGSAQEAFTLTGQMGLIEGIAFRPTTGDTFLGDMHQRCVWRRDAEGTLTRFSKKDERVLGVGGMVVDETLGILWAACSAQKVMINWTEAQANQSALVGFDLSTGAVKIIHRIPADDRAHATVDLTLAPNGTLYLSDSIAPVIWRLSPGADQLDKLIDDARFRSLQGLALSKDATALFVADYALGLFRIDVATGNITALSTPPGSTLIGIDGLARDGSQLIAVQNGVNPTRVLAIDLDENHSLTSVHELAAALPKITDPTLGYVDDGQFTFIADAGWRYFMPGKSPPVEGRAVPVLSISLNP